MSGTISFIFGLIRQVIIKLVKVPAFGFDAVLVEVPEFVVLVDFPEVAVFALTVGVVFELDATAVFLVTELGGGGGGGGIVKVTGASPPGGGVIVTGGVVVGAGFPGIAGKVLGCNPGGGVVGAGKFLVLLEFAGVAVPGVADSIFGSAPFAFEATLELEEVSCASPKYAN